MNYGQIIGDTYTKYVSFNKAVLWKTREISITKGMAERLLGEGVLYIEFIDNSKREMWRGRIDKIIPIWKLKKVGQEEQYYIPIEIFTKKKVGDN